ncbi:uncharacterized protein LOC127719716 isoform X2 [Mytilus californianus]|uniref:uncharacterized protein LOC127719716 isoform X2 n=1 Tax=Mytilus californianus TaxID=6549 RepID=UPI002246843C|nr:uncharacterized protein LOC127719716 isoform X2 [Mytilus californianus]
MGNGASVNITPVKGADRLNRDNSLVKSVQNGHGPRSRSTVSARTNRSDHSKSSGENYVPSKIVKMEGRRISLKFATFKFGDFRQLTFSELHHFYTDEDEKTLEEIPPPHSPYTRKNEFFDPDDYAEVDKCASGIPKSKATSGTLKTLVSLLTDQYEDDMSKVRAIYVWLTSININKLSHPLKNPKVGYTMFYLMKIKERLGNYSQLFNRMCNIAGIPCVVIHGYLKGNTYEIGQKLDIKTHYGEWNAVLISSQWRFVNAFWGACALGSEKAINAAQYKPDENYFVPDPQHLIHTHFPEEEKWQLLDDPITFKEWEGKAYLKERFFELELRLLSHQECEITTENGEIEMMFALPKKRAKNLKFMALVYIKEFNEWKILDDKKVQHDFIHVPIAEALVVKLRFPKRGVYRFELVGKDTTITEKDYDFDWVAIYKIKCEQAASPYSGFPRVGAAGWGPGNDHRLEDLGLTPLKHTQGMIFAKDGFTKLRFKFEEPELEDLSLSVKMITVKESLDEVPTETEGIRVESHDKHVIDIETTPGEESAACVFALVEDKTYGSVEVNICNYLIVSFPIDEITLKDIESTRKTLLLAIEQKKLDLLEKAVDIVETKNYERHMPKETETARDLIARLRNIQRLMHDVLALDNRVFAEIRSYPSPIPEIHDVMKAALLLLGNFEEETKYWDNVQALLGKIGKESIKRRIALFDIDTLELDIALGARKMLGNLLIDNVKQASAGAATFYVWIMGVIEEVERRNYKVIDNTFPRTKRQKK